MNTRKFRDPRRRLALSALGFTEEPFSISADPRFLYLSAQHGEVLDNVQSVVEDHRGLAVIAGTYGIGKSSIARRLEHIYRMYPDEFFVVYVHSASYPSEFEAALDLSAACNLTRRKGLTVQWRDLENFLVSQRGAGRNVVFILDEAQRMASGALSAIQTIYNFDVSQKIAQVILFGQIEIQDTFAKRPEVRSRVYSWQVLNALSVEEAYELIRFRCNVAGRKEPFLTQAGFLKVWDACGGIPRNLVTLCSLLVDEAGDQEKSQIDDLIIENTLEKFLIGQPQLAFPPEAEE